MTVIINIDCEDVSLDVVEKAATVLKNNGLVVYPTDTAYGIAANSFSEKALNKLYTLQNRSFEKPTHVVVKDWEMIELVSRPDKNAYRLYEEFFPGPLTMILQKNEDLVPDMLTGNLETIGVRIPDNSFTQTLSNFLPFPYTTPSANRTGEKTPYSVKEVENVLDLSLVDLVIDAGELLYEKPSTLVDLTKKPFEIVREGPIAESEIKSVIR